MMNANVITEIYKIKVLLTLVGESIYLLTQRLRRVAHAVQRGKPHWSLNHIRLVVGIRIWIVES